MKERLAERSTHRVIRERRRYRRVKVTVPLRWTSPDARATTWIDADTVNCSPTGVLFTSEWTPGIRPGLQLAIVIELPEREIFAIARVVDIRRPEEAAREMLFAIEFTAIQTGDVKALTQFLVAQERLAKPTATTSTSGARR